MAVQSLLFQRDAGWTESKAKSWAKSHGYKHGSVDVTDQYIRLRQFSPKGLKVQRTITLGRGIRAVVAREESMRTVKATRRPRRSKKKVARRAPRKRSRRKATKKATTRRRRRRVSAAAVQAPRRRRRRVAASTTVAAPRRRRRRRSASAWRGDSARHSAAAKKGHRRRKARKAARKTTRRRRSRRTREVMAAPRRRRRVRAVAAAPRRRRYAASPRRGGRLDFAGLTVAAVSTGLGFVLADGLDRFLATYNPTAAEKPKDKFTSDGAGTLANTLNVAARPGLVRVGAGVGMVAVPALGAMYIRSPMIKAAAQGAALGAFASLFKTVWNNFFMPMLKPKDTSAASLQKSYIARLYPAEVAASINREQAQTSVSSAGGAGALSGPGDVGPFALAADSPYPDAAQALRREAGMQGPGGDYPTQQNVWGTGEYPTAAQVLYKETGKVGDWSPGSGSEHGVGPQAKPGEDPSCGCIGSNPFLGFIGDTVEEPIQP